MAWLAALTRRSRQQHGHPRRGRTVVPAAAGLVALLAAVGWWRLDVHASKRSAPGPQFFLGLLVLGAVCFGTEFVALASTRHQHAAWTEVDEPAGVLGHLAALARGLGELAVDAVAAVAMAIALVLVLVAVLGLGLHALG